MTESNSASSPALSRTLLPGIALSLLLHALLFIGPRMEPRLLPDLQRLDVTLVRTAPQIPVSEEAPAAQPPAPKKKPQHPKSEPQTAQASTEVPLPPPETMPEPAPLPENTAEATEDTPATDTDSALAAEAVPPTEAAAAPGTGGQAWPRMGRVTYIALMGEQRIPMGRAMHQWEIGEDSRYRITEYFDPRIVEPIPWYRPGRRVRESSGRITATGLRPERFSERVEGRPVDMRADLDRSAGEFRSTESKEALPENAQDILSLLYQLGYPGTVEAGPLPVTAGGTLQSFRLEYVGEENLQLPFGQEWRTRHVRARYGTPREMTDVWLATDHFSLPVLIRTVDSKGVIYYLVASEVLVSREVVQQAP